MSSASPASGPETAAGARPADVLARRYGTGHRTVTRAGRRGPSPRGWLLIAALATVLSGLFVVWIVLGSSARPESKDISFAIQDSAHATVDFDLTKDPQQTVTCAVQALNEQYAVVGWTEVTISHVEPSELRGRTSTHRVPVRTTNLATTAGVDSCWAS